MEFEMMNADGHYLIYITVGDAAEAEAIGRKLVEARLAACANIVEPMRSIYWWEGNVQEAKEAILLLKTRGDLVQDAIEHVKRLHSYECPCIVALPISSGDPDFLRWIAAETRPPG